MKYFLLIICSFAISKTSLKAQINFSANNKIPFYGYNYSFGSNMGYYAPWSDIQLSDIAAGNKKLNILGAGVTSLRPALFEHFLEYWGYDIRLNEFKHYDSLGLKNNVVFVGYPSKLHRSTEKYCTNTADSSELFANMYTNIWDGGANGTPINDNNYYAAYMYKMVTKYKPYVKIWEVWNEPDYSFTVSSELPANQKGSWWSENPKPCEYALRAPIQQYIRLLRISYEVIKYVDPNAFVAVGGLGYPSFLDGICRNTDNTDDGKVTPDFPLKGGAYFDVMSFHSYPHIDGSLRVWNNAINGFTFFRHSDAAVEGYLKKKNGFNAVLNNYGYDNKKYPQKIVICTETNVPAISMGEYYGDYNYQRNYIVKATIKGMMQNVKQMHVYALSELKNDNEVKSEFDKMGLFKKLEHTAPYQQKINPTGIAYRLTSNMLNGFNYDTALTKKLNLSSEFDGGAFTNTKDTVMVLWTKTRTDQDENIKKGYFMPTTLGIQYLKEYNLNAENLNNYQIISSNFINLTGAPKFYKPVYDISFPTNDAKSINCYPNPTNQEINLVYKLDNDEEINLNLFKVNGQTLESIITNEYNVKGWHKFRYDMSSLQDGLYILTLDTPTTKNHCKVVVDKN
jgi:hypothetical protein